MSTGVIVFLRLVTVFTSGACLGAEHWFWSVVLMCAWLYLPYAADDDAPRPAKSGRRS